MYRPINQRDHSEQTPSPYSHFIFFTGAAIAAGLLLSAYILLHIAPQAPNTYTHLYYIKMGKCCIESSFAAMVSVIFAAAIGDYIFIKR